MNLARRISGLIARKIIAKPARSRGGRAIASVTFDDFPKSAWTVGGAILARHSVRATYYTAGSLCDRVVDGVEQYSAPDLEALRDAGHEIGCHGFSHRPSSTMSNTDLVDDVERNALFLKTFLNGAGPASYSFPYGDVTTRSKRCYARRFTTARGVHPGVNTGTFDLAQLNTVAIESRLWNETRIAASIAQAKAEDGWVVFHTHDVSDNSTPYGCTPPMLECVLKQLDSAGIQILPVREALEVVIGEAA